MQTDLKALFLKALDTDNNYSEAHLQLALLYQDEKDYKNVEKHFQEAINSDNKDAKFFFTRMSVNSTYPIVGNQFTIPHNDHTFPHTNFICYLTDDHGGGGRTLIDGHQPHKPVEDECIVFTGEHYSELPKKGRRIVIVGTFACY